jgi:hypothetical protein
MMETTQFAESRARQVVADTAGAFDRERLSQAVLEIAEKIVMTLLAERTREPAPTAVSQVEPRPEPLFRCEGRYWTIAGRDDNFRLKDVRGLGYIAELLRNPQRRVHLTELLAAADSRPEPWVGIPRRPALGDAGEVLDAKAKAAYRRRLEELREEIREAKAAGAEERASRLEAEIDELVRELASAIGLRGRDRRAGSGIERARFRVTKAIRAAIRNIEEASPSLGHHLATTIKTGTFCCYVPDPANPPCWRF